jgi:hypothetical protein
MIRDRWVSWCLATTAAVLTLGGGGALSLGCGDTTGQDRVSFAARAGGFEHAAGPVAFRTTTGWNVTLTYARIAVGPVYLNTIEALSSRLLEGLRGAIAPRAWAHGESHLGAGQVVAQITRQIEVDVLSPTLVDFPGGGDGLDVPARTAELWLYNRDGAMRGAALRVRGEATRDGDPPLRVHFEGALVADASIVTPQAPLDVARRVRGVPISFTPSEGGTLTVRIDPRRWFDGADFSELSTLHGDTPCAFTLTDNVGRAFLANARASRGVYALSFEPPSTSATMHR